MPPVVVDLKKTEDPRDVVHRAVQALAEGKLVVLPTETVYGLAASALDASAVQKLIEMKGRDPGKPMALAIHGSESALDYIPDLSPLAERLARRCWPGPLTLVLDDQHPDSVVQQLPPIVRQAVSPEGTLGLRVPGHDAVLAILRLCAGPLVLTSANRSGGPDPVTAREAQEVCGDDVTLILDDGRCRFGQPSSVVRVRDNSFQILRSGVFGEAALKQLSTFVVLFVCTGNTCRSPMAAGFCRKFFSDILDCSVDELDEFGYKVDSAGIAAFDGVPASGHAVEVCRKQRIDLTSHRSRQLTLRDIEQSDLIFTMSQNHRAYILQTYPLASHTCFVLDPERDIQDPVGLDVDVYRNCFRQISENIIARKGDIL